jgi:hypothetical protein
MKKYFTIILSISLLCHTSLLAQKVIWGDVQQSNDKSIVEVCFTFSSPLRVFGFSQDKIYLSMSERMQQQRFKTYARAFSLKKLNMTEEVPLSGIEKKLYFLEALPHKGEYKKQIISDTIMSFVYSDEKDRYYAQHYDAELRPMGRLEKLLVLAPQTRIYKKSESQTTGMFGNKTKISVTMDDDALSNTNLLNQSTIVDDKGNTYVFGNFYPNAKVEVKNNQRTINVEYDSKKPDVYHKVILLSKNGTKKEREIKTEENTYLTSNRFFFDDDGMINILSIYSTDNNNKGFLFIKLDRELKIIKQQKVPFTSEMLDNKKEMEYLSIKDFHISSDKSIYITAEEAFSALDGRTVIHRNSIICIKISKNFNISYIKSIHKLQNTFMEKEWLLSCTSFVHNENLYILYNDNVRNENILGYKKIKIFNHNSKTALFLVKIDKNGQITKKILQNPDELGNFKLALEACTMITSNELILFAIDKIKYKLGKIILD